MMRTVVLALLVSACAHGHPAPRVAVVDRVYECDVYRARDVRGCVKTHVSTGDITLHHGDLCEGEVESNWFVPQWLVSAVVTSRGFCDVEWRGDKVSARYCGEKQTFHAPRKLNWVIVKRPMKM